VPTSDDLNVILRKRSGDLAETPYAHLLLALAVREQTATLDLRRTPLEKSIVFDAGSPVECRSNIATEMLGRFLVAQGKLSDEDARNALNAAAARGIPLGEMLVERKLLSPTDLYRTLQQNLGRKLLEPFSWTSGTWEISYDAPAAASALRVKAPQLIVTGVMKVLPQESADAAMASVFGKYLSLWSTPFFPLDDVRLTKDQQKVVDAAREALAFDELRTKSGIDTDDLHRIVYALTLLGIVTATEEPVIEVAPTVFFEDIELQEPQARTNSSFEIRNPKSKIQSPVAPAPPPPSLFELRHSPFDIQSPPPETPAATRPTASPDEVISAYLSYRRKDSFDLLAVEEDAPVSAFIRAFIDESEKFHPAAFDADAADGLREKAQEVFLALARAYAELADPDRREALIKRRALLREEAAKAAERSRTALIDPEELCKTGRALAAAGKLREALGNLEMAAQCDAQNGTYAAEAAWTRFRLNATPATNALKLLKNAIRIDPQAGVAYLYAGQVLAVLGQKVEASGYLGRAASLLPNDPRPAEAAKRV
jgi:tetratricopeptide (TPR) repeat protein